MRIRLITDDMIIPCGLADRSHVEQGRVALVEPSAG